MIRIIPLFRIFDYEKAKEFYVDWLGFEIINQHTFGDNPPLYMQIKLGEIDIHLTEHHGDCSPGAKIIIKDFPGLRQYHTVLLQKNYKYNKPGFEKCSWNSAINSVEVIDPFNNVILFTG